ncbi:T9SS type B sorting domain-containing protein [Rudanella paleaurantiibacter]|uniref:T9SS type B sorting domain-containing protein n=1 Tax=Rudanella paleaurantiibacter TaxID=2614655 RepID=A0A7J5TVG4_9BACT|nr:gliding motility-associated C-terminal domain-containing protein [Rudanella paleaurantiibacter]KAB7727913.1 T9SS type B sorting domain-containing protein [Rudanella paleaurantiibacter]
MPTFYQQTRFKLLIAVLFLLSWTTVRATHIVGGELELQYLGASSTFSHRINMNLYFDDINGNRGAVDQTVFVYVFRKRDNGYEGRVALPLVGDTFVNYSNAACAIGNLRTRLLRYSIDVTFSNNFSDPEGYYMVWERCCRNNSIANIINPGGAGSTFWLEFAAPWQNSRPFVNSTPSFGIAKGDYICTNRPFSFDFSARDADGDSLVYSMATPLNGYSTATVPDPSQSNSVRGGPYPLVSWAPGLSATNAIPGTQPLRVDPRTGLLTVVANTPGLYVFSVLVEEYRRTAGRPPVRIGQVRRDFQLQVVDCPPNDPPRILMKPQGAKEYYKRGTVLTINEADQNCLTLFLTDPNPNQRITITNASGTLPGLSLTPNIVTTRTGTDTVRAEFCFGRCLTNGVSGRVTLAIRATDESCPQGLTDTLLVQLNVIAAPINRPRVVTTLPQDKAQVTVGGSLSFNVVGTDQDNDIVSVQAIGRGFTLASANMSFATGSGSGRITQPFVWRPSCTQATRGKYLVDFVVTKTRCNRTLRDTVTVDLTAVGLPSQPPTIRTSLPNPVIELTLNPADETRSTIQFDVLGNDPDRDSIRLTGTVRGGSMADLGVSWRDLFGRPSLQSGFLWQPSCELLQGKEEATFVFDFVADDRSCQPKHADTTSVTVRLKNPTVDYTLNIPNVFTPNNDGINDFWSVADLPADNCSEQFQSVEIVNRWGQVVYRTKDRNFRWTGANTTPGVYYYLIKYTRQQWKGTVTLYR